MREQGRERRREWGVVAGAGWWGAGEGAGEGVCGAQGWEFLYLSVLGVVSTSGFSVFLFPCWCLEPVLGNPSSGLVYFPRRGHRLIKALAALGLGWQVLVGPC